MTTPITGLSVWRLHYSADPEKASPEWKAYAQQGQSSVKFAREMEMDARAGALTAIFREAYRPGDHERPLDPTGVRLLHAWDFGKGWPARVWFGRTAFNGLRVYASLVGQSLALRPFAEQTVAFEVHTWGEILSGPRCFCDPAGNQDKDDGLKSIAVLREFGWEPRWRGGGVEDGIEQLADLMRRVEPDGTPAFLVDPRFNAEMCRALAGGYRRNRAGVPDREHPAGDLVDALRYGVRGTTAGKVPRRIERPMFTPDPVSGYGRAPIPAMRSSMFEEEPR